MNACMHQTSVLQITEDSLINKSCMSIQRKAQLRLKTGKMYYQLQELSYKENSCMQKEFIPWDLCSFTVCWSSVWDQCHTRLQLDNPGKTAQGNLRLGGQRRRHINCLFYLWAVVRDCTESWIAVRARAMCNLEVFPLVW